MLGKQPSVPPRYSPTSVDHKMQQQQGEENDGILSNLSQSNLSVAKSSSGGEWEFRLPVF